MTYEPKWGNIQLVPPRVIQTTGPSGLVAPHPATLLRPVWRYSWDRRTSGANPLWVSSGELAGGTALGAGGAANPLILQNGIPGYYFNGSQHFTLQQANTLNGDPPVSVMGWVRVDLLTIARLYEVGTLANRSMRGIFFSRLVPGSIGLHFEDLGLDSGGGAFSSGETFFFAATKIPGRVETMGNILFYKNAELLPTGDYVNLGVGNPSVGTLGSPVNNIGRWFNAVSQMVGNINELMEIPRVLSPEEIRWYYENTRHVYGV